jgi:hypothetical protein
MGRNAGWRQGLRGKERGQGAMRGFLSGVFWGLVLSGVGLSAASLMAPQPAGNRPPDAPLVEAPAEAQGETDVAAGVSAPAVEAEAPAAVAVAGPAAPVGDSVPAAADTAPAEVPALGVAVDGLAPPPMTLGAVDGMAPEGEAVDLGAVARAPVVPAPETEVAAETTPAAPLSAAEVAPVPEVDIAIAPPEIAGGEVAPDVAPDIAAEDAAERVPATGVAEPAQPADPAAGGDAPVIGGDAPPALPEVAQVILPPVADVAAGEIDAPAVAAADLTAEAATEVVAEADVPAVAISPGLPAGTGAEAAALPQVGAAPVPDAPAVAPEELPGVNGEARLPGGRTDVLVNRPSAAPEVPVAAIEPALARFAADWASAGGLPQMAIVLVDDGTLGGAAAAVAALPMPVTVAIEPGSPGAAEAMAAYRAAGIEVMAVSRLPAGATPTDVAVTYEAVFARLPEIIGMIDTGEGGLQDSREVTEQAMARLAADGRGAVVPGGGLNMATRAAGDAGVPVAILSRSIDPEGADAAAIRRALDQAAFRARQESGEVLLGRVQAETLSALMLWGTGGGVERVEVAPVSALLLNAGG